MVCVNEIIPKLQRHSPYPEPVVRFVGSLCVSSVPSMCFQLSSSGLPVCSNHVNELWIATGGPLRDSISQSGFSVGYSVVSQTEYQLSSSVFQLCIQLVWLKLFELCLFHLNCNLKYTKTIMVLKLKAFIRRSKNTHLKSRTGMHCGTVNSEKKAEFTPTHPHATRCPTILPFQIDMAATLLNSVCLCRRNWIRRIRIWFMKFAYMKET